MNIYFAGTPNSAAEILNSLASNDLINIMGVITQPDKRGKRGSKLIESPVSLIANSLKLKTYKHEIVDKKNSITTENTISKLINILDKKKLLDAKYSINIKKNIPIRSGMGGGSMNAATLLNYFVSNKIIKADKKEIYEIAHKVGSDVVIGIYNKNKTLN